MTKPVALAPLLALLSLALGRQGEVPSRQGTGDLPRPGCLVCHPGALASLRRSAHAFLIQKGGSADPACMQCHGTGRAHPRDPRNPEHFPGKVRKPCRLCHRELSGDELGRGDLFRLAHPSKAQAREGLPEGKGLGGFPGAGGPGLEIEGLLRAGWRLVEVAGSERGFDQDLGLDPGPRLSRFDLGLRRPGEGELLRAGAEGIEDREMRFDLSTGRALSESGRAEASFLRRVFVHDAQGDFFSLDRSFQQSRASLELDPGEVLRIDYEGVRRRGRTLASRIGNQNQSPLLPAGGVPVDFRLASRLLSLGIEKGLEGGGWSLEAGWSEQVQRDELAYSRPSPANPGFTESEVASSRASFRGPEARAHLSLGGSGGRRLLVLASGSLLESRFVEEGILRAYDSSAFTNTTLGLGSGRSRSLHLRLELSLPAWEEGEWELSQELRDRKDLTRLRRFETTARLSSTLTTREDLEHLVRLQERSSRLGLGQDLGEDLHLALGYRFLEQRLQLPDLEAGDPDFRSGTLSDHGPDLGLDWRLSEGWRLRGDLEWASTGGRTPTETEPEEGLRLLGRLRRELGKGSFLEGRARLDRRENDLSSTRRRSQGYVLSLSLATGGTGRLRALASWNRMEAQSLSNFYVAPSTSPVPTLVGFRGETSVFELGFETELFGALQSSTDLSFQRSTGDLASSFLVLAQDLGCRVREDLGLGLRWSFYGYDDRESPGEDYEASVLLLYAELSF